ncbi:(2Fe-2S)-binding protein [Cognatiyoonia sp. IB215182]|uniref:(2Fe-2S)-binding protein n=1 Tax=Cognatiyoonia sp. IB215182 TaxID=3097353 RepID=UPI002A160942|nr:(2Fe-2S)-binding protein [Cognatiyoonia sp. IB215182]MDX8355026.1 (2Fe-2S)-binding protein [Cognatiyoonia sp. IB215182]
MSTSFELNGQTVTVDVDPEMPLLWAVRETLGLTGTKFGCGIAACGACTMHVDGVATRTCVLPVAAVEGSEVRTIEGIAPVDAPSAVQRAWLQHQVPQCGYCQSGMIMAVEALLDDVPDPTDEDIDAAITNICRCGTYDRIRAAVRTAANLRREA